MGANTPASPPRLPALPPLIGSVMTATRDHLPCFKAYDIRGRVPDELDENLAREIGRAFVHLRGCRKVVVGHDMRLSSEAITAALTEGILSMGADVIDIGLCGTELIYFATAHLEAEGVDGGIVVTASHNPADYNGMKMVGKGSVPISQDTGLREIERLVLDDAVAAGPGGGTRSERDVMDAYVQHLLTYVDLDALKPLKLVSNAGNGCAGLVIEALGPHLPFEFVPLQHEPDGTFPHGVPNPLLEENRTPTIAAVRSHGADFGLAWDGDHDRCFFFDDKGGFIEGYYMVGLFAEELLLRDPGGRVVHDPRLTWNTVQMVEAAGGRAVLCKSGHAFIKERMRAENAVYGGEMSAHHYFRDFAYCDSGMIPWLLVAGIMSRTGKSLSELVGARQSAYPCSGERNLTITDPKAALMEMRRRFEADALAFDDTDGVSLEFDTWRFNLRMSNTEPVVRLNVETRADAELLATRTDELIGILRSLG